MWGSSFPLLLFLTNLVFCHKGKIKLVRGTCMAFFPLGAIYCHCYFIQNKQEQKNLYVRNVPFLHVFILLLFLSLSTSFISLLLISDIRSFWFAYDVQPFFLFYISFIFIHHPEVEPRPFCLALFVPGVF